MMQPAERDRFFDRFTKGCMDTLYRAEAGAKELKHDRIGTEHLLLGMARAGEDDPAKRALANLGIEPNKVLSAIESIIGQGNSEHDPNDRIEFDNRAYKVLQLAVNEADRLNSSEVTSSHLLLGIVREGEGIAAGVLESLGINLERVRAEVMRTYPREQEEQGQEPRPRPTPEEIFGARVARVLAHIPDEGKKRRLMEYLNDLLKPFEES